MNTKNEHLKKTDFSIWKFYSISSQTLKDNIKRTKNQTLEDTWQVQSVYSLSLWGGQHNTVDPAVQSPHQLLLWQHSHRALVRATVTQTEKKNKNYKILFTQ